MTLIKLTFWIIVLTAAAAVNYVNAITTIPEIRKGKAEPTLRFLFSLLAVLFCTYVCYQDVKDIAEYEKAPKVITSQPPVIRGAIRDNGDTLYVFYFKDNIPQDQLKAHQ